MLEKTWRRRNQGWRLVQPLLWAEWRFLKKLKIELPHDSAIPLLGIYLEKTKTNFKRYSHSPMFVAALFAITKTWKQPKCPLTDKWVKKLWYIYTVEYYSAVRKEWHMPFAATWIGLEIIIQMNIVRQDKYITYVWNLKNSTDKFVNIYKTETDSQT